MYLLHYHLLHNHPEERNDHQRENRQCVTTEHWQSGEQAQDAFLPLQRLVPAYGIQAICHVPEKSLFLLQTRDAHLLNQKEIAW